MVSHLTVAVTGLLMLPPLSIVEAALSSIFLAGLIPQAVPLAIPIGLTFGIAFGMAGRAATKGDESHSALGASRIAGQLRDLGVGDACRQPGVS